MPDEEHWDWDFDSQADAHDHSETEQESAPMGDNQSRKKLGSHSRTPSSTSQTHQAEHSLARGPRRPRNPSRIKANATSSKGDDWDLVEDGKETISEDTWEGIANPTPSYDFPGTWDTAIHQTNHAVREVTIASKSYCTALYNSGITKAGYSIGSALAGTTNRSALAVAGWAVQSTGTDTEQLPGGVQKWLRGKERLDEAKRSALNAEKARLARKYKRHIEQKGEAAEGNQSLPQSSEDSRESSPRRQSSDQTEEEWNDRSEDDDHGPVYLGQLDEDLDYQSKNIVQRPSHSHRASSTLDTGFRTEDCRPIEEEHLISPMDSRVPAPDNKWASRDQNSNSLFSPDFRLTKEMSPEPSSAHIGPTLRDPRPTNSVHYNNPTPVAPHVPSRRAPQQEQYDKSSYPDFGNQNEGYFGRYAVQSNEPRQQYVTTPAAPFMSPRHAFNEEAPDDYERFQYMSAVSSLPVNPRQEEYEFQEGRKHEEEEYGMDFHGMFETE